MGHHPSPLSDNHRHPWADHGLYALVVCIWGSSWVGLKMQVGADVPALVSVFYRFALSAAVLFGWCHLRGISLRYSLAQHGAMATQGILLFAVNYALFYNAAYYLTGGLIAIVFSTVVIMNLFLSLLITKAPIDGRLGLGAALGLVGIVVVFIPELGSLALSDQGLDAPHGNPLKGVGLALAGTACAAVGMTLSARNQRAGLTVLASNAWGMGYAAIALFATILVSGTPLRFSWTPSYVGGLLYLSLISSVVAFGAYLTLVGRIGVTRASYASVLFPIIALALSTVTEGYQWTLDASLGIILVLSGNVLVLYRPRPPATLQSAPQPAQETP